MIGIQGVAGARVVAVFRTISFQDVIRCVLQPAEAEGRAFMITLGSVVVHDVQDHFNARPVQRLHHIAKLVDGTQRILPGAVGQVRSKERHRAISPVVHPARWAVLRIELKDGQQFDRGDPEVLQVGNFLDQPSIRAAFARRDPGIGMTSKASQVHLVNHGPGVGVTQRPVPFPIVSTGVRDHALHRLGCVVAGPGCRGTIVVARYRHGTAVGVQQHFLRIEPETRSGVKRPMDPISIELPRLRLRNKSVPVVVCPVPLSVERNHSRGPRTVGSIKEKQLDC